ncbi:hypothetical protein Cgig2_018007 [Carnegiea gigantea]|uniref:Uncharacterized protein n=1 Tax=Carnegiea gigantea TaxID=171969 RepID=A0A9Q1GP76_9CARY|nr:hypothetical protein Cgig2_018007 [Carnegiea gigantea]
MGYLTALQSLKIIYYSQLESVPEWTSELTSINQLEILGCSFGLRERFHNPTWEDWPNIQHIPDLKFTLLLEALALDESDMELGSQYAEELNSNAFEFSMEAGPNMTRKFKDCPSPYVGKDEHGEITSSRIHDLMHDIAYEIFYHNKIWHLPYTYARENSIKEAKIRTHLCGGKRELCAPIHMLVRNWISLRALVLSESRIKSVPSALGKLLHKAP